MKENTSNKTAYSENELLEFKAVIEKKLKKAKDELAFYEDELKSFADNEDSRTRGLDDGIATTENSRMATLVARQNKFIQNLENALIRIENKTYGVCRQSGKLISKARLMAVPHATLSMEAKQNRKK